MNTNNISTVGLVADDMYLLRRGPSDSNSPMILHNFSETDFDVAVKESVKRCSNAVEGP